MKRQLCACGSVRNLTHLDNWQHMCKVDSKSVLVSVTRSSTSTQTEKRNRSSKAESEGEQGVVRVLVIVGTISGADPQVGSVDV
jgi:hypothetical protein